MDPRLTGYRPLIPSSIVINIGLGVGEGLWRLPWVVADLTLTQRHILEPSNACARFSPCPEGAWHRTCGLLTKVGS